MGSESPSSKKEPPWLSILPPMPRISVSSNSRARLSHRCPGLLPPSTPPAPVFAPVTPPSPPSRPSPQSADTSSESSRLQTLPPFSSAASESSGPSCFSSSAGLLVWDSAGSFDAATEPCNGDSARSLSSGGAASELVAPLKSDERLPENGSHSPGALPIARIPIPSPFSPQQASSAGNGYVGFGMDGLNGADDPDIGELGTDGRASSSVSETTSSAGCCDGLEEDVDEYGGAGIRVNRENCVDVYREAETPDLLWSEEVIQDEGELDEGQQVDGRGTDAKQPDLGRSSKACCASRDMNVTTAESKSSPSCHNAVEVEDGCKEGGVRMNYENCSHIGGEAEISDSVDKEEPVLNEGELEEGQLPGEWSGGEESNENSEPAPMLEDSAAVCPVMTEVPMFPMVANVTNHMFYPFQGQGIQFEQRSGGNNKAKGKKKKKHKKGEGSKKRSREKSKEKYNEVLKKRTAERKGLDGGSNSGGLLNSKDNNGGGGKTGNNNGAGNFNEVSEKVSQTLPKKPTVDEGPEDGEILLESTKTNDGILSSLVEAEVGLWTTDDVDDQFVAEMEQDGTVKRKRGPETAERKLKRKIAKRKKRAQKERELGIRRPPRMVQSKPVKVLCTHYMKGRCAKGDKCTFSHDAVPLTKQEPCKFLMSHSCLKGDDCPYSHDLRAFPCKFFHTRGLCYDGENCQFSHGDISEEALAKLKQRVEKEKKDRLSSNSTLDIPSPSFSTPLPPDLDPDPLGWGTPSFYSSQEDQMQYTSPTNLDLSTRLYGDINLENHASSPPAQGTMQACQSTGFSTSPDRKDTEFDSVPQWIREAPAEYNNVHFSNTNALQSQKLIKIEGESSVAMASEGPYPSTIPKFSRGLPCPSSANETGNAKEVLEVPLIEGKMNPANSLGREALTISKESGPWNSLSGLASLVSPLLARSVVPILRGRQLGSLVLEHDKVLQSPLQTEPKRQHTVDSLLNEALRQ